MEVDEATNDITELEKTELAMFRSMWTEQDASQHESKKKAMHSIQQELDAKRRRVQQG